MPAWPGATTTSYAVRLPVFEGPLDLLLYLIEREQLDITQVSLAQVADQYLAYLKVLEQLNVEQLADFLVIAARLILIKSQALLPRPPAPPEIEEVGDDLVRQLLVYKQFKEVARGLSLRQETGRRSFVRLAPPPKIEVTAPVDLGDVSVEDLLAAVRRVLAMSQPSPSVGTLVRPFVITIRDQIELIQRTLRTWPRISFVRLLSQATSRVEIIVTFLAVLELLKRQCIRVGQEKLFGEIIIEAVTSGETPSLHDENGDSFTDYEPQ